MGNPKFNLECGSALIIYICQAEVSYAGGDGRVIFEGQAGRQIWGYSDVLLVTIYLLCHS